MAMVRCGRPPLANYWLRACWMSGYQDISDWDIFSEADSNRLGCFGDWFWSCCSVFKSGSVPVISVCAELGGFSCLWWKPDSRYFLSIFTLLDNSILYSSSNGCSIARTADRILLDLLSFCLRLPTPGHPDGRSSCGASLMPTIVINQVNADDLDVDNVEFYRL